MTRAVSRITCSKDLRSKRVRALQKRRYPTSCTIPVTAEDLCLFARELFDESRSGAGGVARVWPKEFCLSVFNCGWSTGAYERALEGGFECFRAARVHAGLVHPFL
jgi:hypothetical protein